MGVTWGPMRKDDVEQLAELSAAIEEADQLGENYDADDFAEHLADPLLDLAEGTLVARNGEHLLALAILPVKQKADDVHRMTLWAGVHPAHRGRGYGTHILDWATRTASTLHERVFPGKPLELTAHTGDTNSGAVALLERSGFTESRRFFSMQCDLDGDLPARPLPDGLSITTWTPELDPHAMAVRNESFRDHWGSVEHTPTSWKTSITGVRAFRPEGTFLAMSGDHAAGVLITHYYEADTEVTGVREAWLLIIGTRKAWRGKGVASALIAHALAEFKKQGYGRAGLGVDSTNETGALGVYERSGFRVVKRALAFVRRLG